MEPVCITPFAVSVFRAKTQVRLEPGGGGEKKSRKGCDYFHSCPRPHKINKKLKKKKDVIFKYLVREPAVQMQGAVPAAGTWRDLAQALVRVCCFAGHATGLKNTKMEHIGLWLMALPWLLHDFSALRAWSQLERVCRRVEVLGWGAGG